MCSLSPHKPVTVSTMKLNHYGYHASDCTLRFNGVRLAKLTTPDGKVLTIAFAKTITDALNSKSEAALLSFVKTIEDTGGVTEFTGGSEDGGPAIDPEWLDLGDAYREACAALGRKPKPATEPVSTGL